MTPTTTTISEIAKEYALERHAYTGHLYDGKPYKVHLLGVVGVAMDYIKQIFPENEWDTIIAGAWVHDVIEDTRETYNDVKAATSEQVADIAYALTNEKGKNRSERANDKYYQGIRDTPYAAFIKICDRIANIRYGREQGGSMLEKYRKEHENFKTQLYNPLYEPLFQLMELQLAKVTKEKKEEEDVKVHSN